jgi:hypothetical protein
MDSDVFGKLKDSRVLVLLLAIRKECLFVLLLKLLDCVLKLDLSDS